MRFAFVFLFALSASAYHEPLQRDVVSVSVEETVVNRGKDNRVTVWVEVQEGYHIQANEVSDESLIPTTLVVDSTRNLGVSRQKFPRRKKFRLEGTDMVLDVYDGKFPVTLYIRVAPGVPAGKTTLNARLRYQACDARTCFFPRVVEFSIPVEVRA